MATHFWHLQSTYKQSHMKQVIHLLQSCAGPWSLKLTSFIKWGALYGCTVRSKSWQWKLECGGSSNPSEVVSSVQATRLFSMALTLWPSWLSVILIFLLVGLQGEPGDTAQGRNKRTADDDQWVVGFVEINQTDASYSDGTTTKN